MPITYPKVGDPIPGTNLKYEAADIANLKSGGGTPTSFKEETPAGVLPPVGGEPVTGDLGNLRVALRSALSEATQQTAASRMQQLSGLVEGGAAPSVFLAAIGLAQSGLRTTQETVFGDIMQSFRDEQDRLREEGRAPEIIGSSETGYYQWDKNSRAWQPISNIAASSFDSGLSDDSWVKLIMAGQANITNVRNSAQQNRVTTLLANELPDPTNKAWVQKQYDEGKAINMTDEEIRKDMVKSSVPESLINEIIPATPKGPSFLEKIGLVKPPTTSTASPFGIGNFSDIHIDDRIAQLKEVLGTGISGATNTYLEKQLIQDGYHPEQIRMRTRTGIFDFMK